MRWTVCSIGAILFAMVSVPGGAADRANGKRLYVAYGCYQCHGREAQGSSATGPRLGPGPIAFDAFARYVRQPSGQMPPYTTKVVSDRELGDIYEWVRGVAGPVKVQETPQLR